MAVATKNLRTLQASTSNGAGSTTTGTASNQTTALGCLVTGKITNGGTGPTVGCNFAVLVSGDNTNFKTLATYTAGTAASGVYEFAVEVPAGVQYVNAQFTGNTGQSVTVEAFLHELTSIG